MFRFSFLILFVQVYFSFSGLAQRYTVIDLGTLPSDTESSGADINNNGQIIGMSSVGAARRPFVWENGAMIELPGLDGSQAFANAINNQGVVAGSSASLSADSRAVLWNSTVPTDLGDLVNNDSSILAARALNDNSNVVGEASSPSAGRAFLWIDGVMSEISGEAVANGISNQGSIIGTDQSGRAFLIDDSTTHDLGDLSNGQEGFSNAAALNESDEVVGSSFTSMGMRAFFWSLSGGMISLGELPGGLASSRAADINDRSQVVGTSEATGGTRAFYWDSSAGMKDLNDLLDDRSEGWVIERASGINNSGHIVATGFNPDGVKRACLLQPCEVDPSLEIRLSIDGDNVTIHYPELLPTGNYHLHMKAFPFVIGAESNRVHTISQATILGLSVTERASQTHQMTINAKRGLFVLYFEAVGGLEEL